MFALCLPLTPLNCDRELRLSVATQLSFVLRKQTLFYCKHSTNIICDPGLIILYLYLLCTGNLANNDVETAIELFGL